MKLYKVLSADGRSCHGGTYEWSLPKGRKLGAWTPKRDPVPCESGWHLCRAKDLSKWIGARIWKAEARGQIIQCDDKIVCESVRIIAPTLWDEVTARLCAADFAARVLANFESKYPGDTRPREAIVAARAYARGGIGSASYSAARSASYSASYSAAHSASRSASYSAARSASYSAAHYAAYSAACSASYSAAHYAAHYAACSASYSAAHYAAHYAAGSAADSAAHYAAGSAADSAEKLQQSKRIEAYCLGKVKRDYPFPKVGS